MKLGIIKDIDWSYVGALLAQSDSEKQTDFFKGFVKECKSWGTHMQVEAQLAEVNRCLTKEERETLSMIGFEEEEYHI